MLTDTTKTQYRRFFYSDPSPYISEPFLGLVENKVERLYRLMDEEERSIGLILGLKDGTLYSPFSAPLEDSTIHTSMYCTASCMITSPI